MRPRIKKELRNDVNSIILVGEVVDRGIMPKHKGVDVRVRLKVRNYGKTIYLDVYGKRSCGEVMTVICQTGNIVYVEGEFRNATKDKFEIVPYVLVTHIACLYRSRDVVLPSSALINVLDKIDPSNYVPDTNPKPRKHKKPKKEEENG